MSSRGIWGHSGVFGVGLGALWEPFLWVLGSLGGVSDVI